MRHTLPRLTPLLLLAALLLPACAPQQAVAPTALLPSPQPATVIPGATVTPVPATNTPVMLPFSVRLMAYNIQDGAGVGTGRAGRLNDILSLVQQADPDLLGIEEATGWAEGSSSAADKLAAALGMSYYLAPVPSGRHLILFSKFPISDTQNLSEQIGETGALRAVVTLPGGQRLNVAVVHLASDNMTVVQPCQFDKLRRLMAAQPGAPSILMGDVNSRSNSPAWDYLTQGGWELAQYEGSDNMFVLSAQEWKRERICFWRSPSNGTCINDLGISDHLPVAAAVSFYSSPNPAAPAAATPAPPEGCK
jgi:endonuclease/exonuclease/phosphatase family metal-dependent hydrolase